MKTKLIAVFVIALAIVGAGSAKADTGSANSYRMNMDVIVPKIITPTVVELGVPNSGLERFDFLVYNKTSKSFEPSLLLTNKNRQMYAVSVIDLNSGSVISDTNNLVDNNENTFNDFAISGDNMGKIRLTITGVNGETITSDSLYLLLDTYVSLPKTIGIKTGADLKTVLATTELTSQVVNFPKTSSNKWVIDLSYGQPLRMTEIRFGEQYNNQNFTSKLRFLAQPGHDYGVYFDPDRRVSVITSEMGNLSDNSDVLKVTTGPARENISYVIADTDGDNIPDIKDNCVSIPNTDQVDLNNNGRGDVCDDFDKDGIINIKDNCPNLPNYNQRDTDGDKIGDICDGEESRITEKYPWLPWVGMIGAGIVVIGLFVFTALSMRKKTDLPPLN